MDNRPIYRQLMALGLPLIASNLLQQLYNTVDAMFVGRYVGSTALAATGASHYIVLILTYFFIGLSVGASITVAQAYGAKDVDAVYEGVHTTIALSLCSGLFLMAVGFFLAPQFLRWVNVPDDVMNEALTYLRIYFCGMIPTFLYNMGSGILRAIGNTKATLNSLIISSIVNIALDFVLIVVFKAGIAGAAIATIAAQAVSALVILFVLIRTTDIYRLVPTKIHFNLQQLKSIIRIGAPAGLQSVLQCLSNVYFQSKINVFGSDAMAAATATNKLDGFLSMPIEGISLAASTLVGQNIGAGRPEQVKRIFRTAAPICVVVIGLMTAAMYAGARPLMSLFNPDNLVAVDYGVYMFRLLIPLYFVYGANQVYAGVIRGTGQSRVPMLIILIFTCGFRLVWVTFFAHDLKWLYLSYSCSWTLTFFVYTLYYHKGNWLKIHLQQAEQARAGQAGASAS